MTDRIGKILLDTKLITDEHLNKALSLQKNQKKKLVEILIELGVVSEQDICNALSKKLRIPIRDCSLTTISSELKELIPKELAREKIIFPMEKTGNTLVLAMSDPLDYRTIDEISFKTKLKVSPVISYNRSILSAIENNYHDDEIDKNILTAFGISEDIEKEVEFIDTVDEAVNVEALYSKSSAPTIVSLVGSVIAKAIEKRASDIHIEPREKYIQVRYRIDGSLSDIFKYDKSIHESVVSRVKIISNLDITNRRLPQDGGCKVSFQGREIDIRISTLPSIYGEKIVMRLLDRSAGLLPLEGLLMPADIKNSITSMLNSPQGMFIVTGPTGSGKTTTLYACLNRIRSETRNIVTIEDPVEYKLEGITQVSVNEAIGLTFASVLRSVLRQDPDVILVGEIRDQETAEIAIKASLTGHLVLTTLHTNNTIATITRLIDIGIPAYLLASAISGILAQRLVRKICNECKVKLDVSDKLYSIEGLPELKRCYIGMGCPACSNTGYTGRLAVYEFLQITPAMRKLISKGASENELLIAAKKEGVTFLFEDGWNKVKDGITTIEEVMAKIPMDYRLGN